MNPRSHDHRLRAARVTASFILLFGAAAVVRAAAPDGAAPDDPAASRPSTQPTESLFRDPEDGAFEFSKFLSTRFGFLPIAMPITEPAVGYGLGLGLTFFHNEPQVVTYPDQPPRVIMPNMTVLFGASTESGTWALGLGKISSWNEGKIRYVGAAGYTNLDLDWFGKGDSLGGQSIPYENDVPFIYQKVTFKLGDSNFFFGPQYRFLGSDATFGRDASSADVPDFQLQSQTSGLGAVLSSDSLDQPFSPTRGVRAEATYSHQAEALGGDFDYGRLNAFGILYVPLGQKFVLGLRADGGLITSGEAPFYDLPGVLTRGIPRGRYVDDAALTGETELRYDLTDRWSLIGFGGVGRVAETFGDLGSADNHFAGGGGVRYLVARQYGVRVGLDFGYSDDGDSTVYVALGTGWVRP